MCRSSSCPGFSDDPELETQVAFSIALHCPVGAGDTYKIVEEFDWAGVPASHLLSSDYLGLFWSMTVPLDTMPITAIVSISIRDASLSSHDARSRNNNSLGHRWTAFNPKSENCDLSQLQLYLGPVNLEAWLLKSADLVLAAEALSLVAQINRLSQEPITRAGGIKSKSTKHLSKSIHDLRSLVPSGSGAAGSRVGAEARITSTQEAPIILKTLEYINGNDFSSYLISIPKNVAPGSVILSLGGRKDRSLLLPLDIPRKRSVPLSVLVVANI